jgi:microcystin-dependent protein
MDPFIGEITMFGGNFAPRNWAFCDGQLLPISEHTALFSILGTTFGGDGRTTFGLPDLQGRFAMHAGNGPGLASRLLGESGGATTATVNGSQMGPHGHTFNSTDEDAAEDDPSGKQVAVQRDDSFGSAANTTMSPSAVGQSGEGQAHNNVHPYQAVNFIIALVGTFPTRS